MGGVGVGFDAGADVPAEALAVEPGLGAVVIADVENVEDIREVTAVKALEDQHFIGFGECDGYSIVEDRGRAIRSPVHRIDAHYRGLAHNRLDIFHVRYGVITYRHPRVVGSLSGLDPGSRGHIARSDLISHHICRHHAFPLFRGKDFHQLHHGFASLAETGENEGPALIEVLDIMAESVPDVYEGHIVITTADRVLV